MEITEKFILKQVYTSKEAAVLGAAYVFQDKNYDVAKKEISFEVNSSPRKKCFRLVHNGTEYTLFEESEDVWETVDKLVCGTEEECVAEIKSLKLTKVKMDSDVAV